MLRLIERNIATVERQLVLLAPPQSPVPDTFQNVTMDTARHRQLVREMQQLRGSVYLRDGAVERRQLAYDGSHRTPEDEKSWHLLMLNRNGRISSCAWYLSHDTEAAAFGDLRVRSCPLAHEEGWRDRLWHAVESELARARRERIGYAEVGGWAVAPESRCTSQGLLLALAAYSLGGLLGHALGLTTATVRHSSSTILRRIGGAHLEAPDSVVPSYYDPRYRCEMELLRFDSRQPSAKYSGLVELLKRKLVNVSVVAYQSRAGVLQPFAAEAPASSLQPHLVPA